MTPDALCEFSRDVALRLPLFQGVHRFFGPLFLREGCRIVQVPVNHRPRAHGRSHYNLRNRSLHVIVDLVGVAWLLRRPVFYKMISADQDAQVHPHSRRPDSQTGGVVTWSVQLLERGYSKEAS